MAEENTETDDQNTTVAKPEPPAQSDEGGQKPPWERDGEDFSPEKAWKLIENLRSDNAKLRESNESSNAKLREIEDSKLTEQEKLQRDLSEAQARLAEADRAKAWADARSKWPQLKEEDFDLLGAATPEEIADKAAKLAARIPAQAADGADQKNINPILRAKPTGGGDPTVTENADWLRDALTK
ncbi:hypothetical protein [Bifidobacterium scardovii]|uniref:Scaffolding protein n=1 Tax=Bifidobacterium scardovii TaxID=158787 RepID=A0A087DGN7_9BIFI|nr:hypothetical protein [Bifidobacterium scardovii]KFI94687.1 hypothetical protein BSCA_0739 [Bifidobacterium scardovii]MDK6349825.1 hypothetical protein [Bifidobacterium scardovii]MDU8982529.1 hypothetical protein [Bifidobacterium scardovii]BAQ32084.1 hypothetical phage protein [Bifidobacterium scardovii JCM 12489 = DSM 13734]